MLGFELFQRAEIWFWMVSVRIMKNLRAVRILLAGSALMVILLVIGIGRAILHPSSEEISSEASSEQLLMKDPEIVVTVEVQRSFHGQRNFLVILVDSITSSAPKLQGVWLIGRAPGAPNLVFLPLFPTQFQTESSFWSDRFALDSDGEPTQDFFNVLQSLDLWWDYYLLMDFTTLAEVIELTGGMERDGILLSGVDVVSNIPSVEHEPESALDVQAQIAENLCRKTNVLMGGVDPEILWGLLTHRMRSDLELETLLSANKKYRVRPGGTSCEFPTFQEMTLLTGIE